MEFLDLYSSNNTICAYKVAIKKFLVFVYKTDFRMLQLEEHASRYIDENRTTETIEQDVEHFFVSIKSKPPKTIMLTLSAINKFLYKNKVKITPEFWEDLHSKVKGKGALTRVEIPTKEQLRNILLNIDLRGKAMILVLSSSGMRIGELMTLKLSEIDLTTDPAKVSISGVNTKSGESRTTFISSEAKAILEQYLKERKSLHEYAQNRAKSFSWNIGEDDRLFPFSSSLLGRTWSEALGKTGLDKKDATTRRILLHIHTLRKFFRTNFGNPDLAEVLMGHEGYLTFEYRHFNEQQLTEAYQICEPNLWILSDSQETEKLKKQLSEKSDQLQVIINTLVVENCEFKRKISETDKILNEVLLNLEQLKAQA